jgi:hypothetical protein
MDKVERFISVVRDSFIGSQQVYTEGSCYHFYLILKEVFPEAKPYYDISHVLTEIDGKFYDITGEVKRGCEMLSMTELPVYSLKAPYNIYKNINP